MDGEGVLPEIARDGTQLQQVFLNLVMNGIEAMAGIVDRSKILLPVNADSIRESGSAAQSHTKVSSTPSSPSC